MIRVLLVDDQELVRSGFRIILDSEPDFEVVGEAADGAEAVEQAERLHPDVICMDIEMPVMNGIEASRRILGGLGGPVLGGGGGGGYRSGSHGSGGTRSAPSVLILTTFGHEQYLFDALAAGVSGFLLKTSRAEHLIDAVRALADGKALLGPDVTRAVLERIDGARADAGAPAAAGAGSETGPLPLRQEAGAPSEGETQMVGETPASAEVPAAGGTPPPRPAAAVSALDDAGLTEREREVLLQVAAGRSNGEIATELFVGEATVKTHVSNLLQKLGARDRVQLVVWAHTRGVV